MSDIPRRLARQPKWVQDHVADLTHKLAEERRRMRALKGELADGEASDSTFIRTAHSYDDQRPIGKHDTVIFKLPEGTQVIKDKTFHYDRFIEARVRDGRLELMGYHGALVVQASASNVMSIDISR